MLLICYIWLLKNHKCLASLISLQGRKIFIFSPYNVIVLLDVLWSWYKTLETFLCFSFASNETWIFSLWSINLTPCFFFFSFFWFSCLLTNFYEINYIFHTVCILYLCMYFSIYFTICKIVSSILWKKEMVAYTVYLFTTLNKISISFPQLFGSK